MTEDRSNDELADMLLSARAEGRQLSCASVPVPADLDEAMRVQALVALALSADVSGWKVAMPGSVAVAAPLFPLISAKTVSATRIPWADRLGIEVELALKLNRDIPKSNDRLWTRAELLDCIEGVYLGIEPVGGRLKEGNDAPLPLYLADSLDNAGYIVGERLPPGIIDRVASGAVPIKISGCASWEGVAAHAHADPLHFLISYANAPIDHLGGLRAGQIVTIGSLCGGVPVLEPGAVRIEFDQRFGIDLFVVDL